MARGGPSDGMGGPRHGSIARLSRPGRSLCRALLIGVCVLAASPLARALPEREARQRAAGALTQVETDLPLAEAKSRRARPRESTPARRIAEGDILLRERNYEAAINAFEQVKELHAQGKVPPAAHADGLFLLGESYMQDEQLLSARRQYRELLERSDDRRYAPYAGRALSRLIDVSIRSSDPTGLDEVFERMSRLPADDATGSLHYARGKAYFARGELEPARRALALVPAGSPHAHQAAYLLGVVFTKEAAVAAQADRGALAPSSKGAAPAAPARRFAAALDQFRRVTRIPADTAEERHVIDLAWMAIGRLFYEADDYLDAADAYSHVDRKSPEFSAMLYELAWVFARLGDYKRAQRALEVLSITDPRTLDVADGALLRADLMLRSGQYQQALEAYQGVRRRFDPIRASVADFLAQTNDPAVYYDQLVDEGLASGATRQGLPPLVIEWARREAEDARVFAMIDDVNRSRDLVRKSRRVGARLNAVLASPTRVKAFPEVRSALESTLGLLNKVALARREQVSEQQWNALSQQLQRLTLEADRLQALVNGLKRVMQDADSFGVAKEVGTRQRFKSELEANERELSFYRDRIAAFQEAVESGRAQVGFGDQRYVDDAAIRARFTALFAREVALVGSGADGRVAADYARSIGSLIERADRADARLGPIERRLQELALARANEIRALVVREIASIEAYAKDLDRLDEEARALVGEVARQNLVKVRDRLKSIVLRADVGTVQQAWELREEQRVRVQSLQRERAIEERKLDDELREVIDDAGDSP